MTKTRRARKQKTTWYWIEGLKKSGTGIKTWFPLYCSKDEAEAQKIESMCRAQAARVKEGLAETKDAKSLSGFRDFRTVSDTRQAIRCTCSSNYLKAIRKEGVRCWKCLNCGRTWERELYTDPVKAPDAPRTLSKPLKRRPGSVDTTSREIKRQKKPQRPVSKRNVGRKIR